MLKSSNKKFHPQAVLYQNTFVRLCIQIIDPIFVKTFKQHLYRIQMQNTKFELICHSLFLIADHFIKYQPSDAIRNPQQLFRVKKRKAVPRQAKTGKYECRNITVTFLHLMVLLFKVIYQPYFETTVCGASLFYISFSDSRFTYTQTNRLNHGRIIKWTQPIGFLTLAGMYPVIKGNHVKNLKEGQQEFFVYRV